MKVRGRLKPTMVQLSDSLLRLLDARARRAGVSRSQVIRDAVEEYLEGDAREGIAGAYRDGYERVPAETPDGWGDLEAWHDELERSRAAAGGDEHSSEWG